MKLTMLTQPLQPMTLNAARAHVDQMHEQQPAWAGRPLQKDIDNFRENWTRTFGERGAE